MVADVHRTLLYGGMFMYPGDKKNIDGKLRVFYECFPMARIVEEAGGYAITTRNEPFRILDIKSKHIHEKTPILLGSKEEVIKYKV
jgi:fructose-1,6-bisphosphatase I